jgi:hypothetical protein
MKTTLTTILAALTLTFTLMGAAEAALQCPAGETISRGQCVPHGRFVCDSGNLCKNGTACGPNNTCLGGPNATGPLCGGNDRCPVGDLCAPDKSGCYNPKKQYLCGKIACGKTLTYARGSACDVCKHKR